jgi:putative flavoprotein involved in K+ transport
MYTFTPDPDVLIVGAGPAGLAVAHAVTRRGLTARIIDRADSIASSWRGHYDCLRLNSGRVISSLPGRRIPRRYGRWVRRDDFVTYLEEYAQGLDADIRLGVTANASIVLRTAAGRCSPRTAR